MATQPPTRPIVFIGVGVFNTLFDFGFYTLLTQTVFKSDSQIALAGIVSGTVALACAFVTHSLVTWRGSHIGVKTILRFVAFTGFGMWVIRPLLLGLFIHLGGLYRWVHSLSLALHLLFSYDFIANTGAFGFMAVILLVYNYLTYDRFVFKKQPPTTASSDSQPKQLDHTGSESH